MYPYKTHNIPMRSYKAKVKPAQQSHALVQFRTKCPSAPTLAWTSNGDRSDSPCQYIAGGMSKRWNCFLKTLEQANSFWNRPAINRDVRTSTCFRHGGPGILTPHYFITDIWSLRSWCGIERCHSGPPRSAQYCLPLMTALRDLELTIDEHKKHYTTAD